MKRFALVVGLVLVLVAVVVVTAVAQSGALAGLVQPVVVNIEQAVPVEITLAVPLESGDVVTVTTPITVGVALQVKIDGAQVVAVASLGDAAEPVVTTEAGQTEDAGAAAADAGALVDNAGMAYAVQGPEGINIIQVGHKDQFGKFAIFGQIRNDSDKPIKYMSIGVSLYDDDGNLIDTTAGLPRATTLAPGDTTIFEAPSMLASGAVASYDLQIEGNQD